MHRMGNGPVGLQLEALVSDELRRLDVPHRRTPHRGEEDTKEHIDLCIPEHGGRPSFEFQLTLRRGAERKMRSFVLAAVNNKNRGVRVYLEVLASFRKDLEAVAQRVARAIREIVHRFRRFEEHDLLGVRVSVGYRKRSRLIERFSLLDLVGDWVMKHVCQRTEPSASDNDLDHSPNAPLQEASPPERVRIRLHPPQSRYWEDLYDSAAPLRGHPLPRRFYVPLRFP